MTQPHKRANRHPKYKIAYRVKNWAEYNQSLRDRGDITLWISQDAIEAWTPPQTGTRGAPPVYADLAIETALTLRLLFRLPLRQTEGFLGSVLTLMGLTLPCPDHTTLSRRNATVTIRQQVDRAPQGPLSLIVDSSGLKVCGQGEWHTEKHGEKKHKRWKKLHIGVDDQGQIIACTVTESQEQDPSQVPALLAQIERELDRFIGDGIYDQQPVYAAVEDHSPGARVIIPPRKDAVVSPTAGSSPTQRDRRRLAGEAGCVPGAGSLASVRIAQSDAGIGSASVLSDQLRARFKGLLLLPVDLCNKAGQAHKAQKGTSRLHRRQYRWPLQAGALSLLIPVLYCATQ